MKKFHQEKVKFLHAPFEKSSILLIVCTLLHDILNFISNKHNVEIDYKFKSFHRLTGTKPHGEFQTRWEMFFFTGFSLAMKVNEIHTIVRYFPFEELISLMVLHR